MRKVENRRKEDEINTHTYNRPMKEKVATMDPLDYRQKQEESFCCSKKKRQYLISPPKAFSFYFPFDHMRVWGEGEGERERARE